MENLREVLTSIYEQQIKDGADIYPCPRCGHNTMEHECVKNALSRRHNVYICARCGQHEAIEDLLDDRISLENWAFTGMFKIV